MRMIVLLLSLTFATSGVSASGLNSAQSQQGGNMTSGLTVHNNQFMIDGQPLQILSGEIHYARVPHQYWRERIRAAKAMGLNTITTYVFWNKHEPSPGVFDFQGDNNIVEFIKEAQQEGLYVILRPGPYACAEWEFGGLPAWLLKDHSMVIRSSDPKFLGPVRSWFNELGRRLAPLQYTHGGPIIAIQVENEYGSFGNDLIYLDDIRRLIMESGLSDSLLYTANPGDSLANGSLPGLLSAVNFGPGDAQDNFAQLAIARPSGPRMAGEYWVGWFDSWGSKHYSSDLQDTLADFKWMLSQGISISLYMFHGGTNFGWMNGANMSNGQYMPYVTSYDYDAPLSESGVPTAKYMALRQAIEAATGVTPPAIPTLKAAMTVPKFWARRAVSLWDVLPTPIQSTQPLSMEDVDQAYGFILYRTTVHAASGAANQTLKVNGLNDYARIYLDGQLVGSLDRRLNQNSLTLDVKTANARLDILVLNSGRINYSTALRGERKGITGQVELSGQTLQNWSIYPLPMDNVNQLSYSTQSCSGPCFFEAGFHLDSVADTFLDTRDLGKGEVWVNGRALGRFWTIGPQQALYLPAPWMKKGDNTVHVFDLDGKPNWMMQGLSQPLLGPVAPPSDPMSIGYQPSVLN